MQTLHGGRFGLRLIEATPERARYQLELSTPDGEWSTLVSVQSADGVLTLGEWSSAPPPWLEQYARAALRDAWRGHGERGWPRRLQRWRAPPTARKDGRGEGSES
ncbi:MAG: hypothetical protein ABW217_01880 [Polyangiaceae bacterium]